MHGQYTLDQVKIFPNRSTIRYVGRIHEQIAPSIAKLGIPFFHSGINVYHDGYVKPEELQVKRQRNLRIVQNWLREEPQNPWANFWYNYIRTSVLGQIVPNVIDFIKTMFQNRLVCEHIVIP